MVNSGDTAFVLISAALVCLMTPGLAFFYGGLVRQKNVLTIMMQSFIAMGVASLIWYLIGFSLAFGPDVMGVVGNLKYAMMRGVGIAPHATYGPTIPFLAFFGYQQMFAIITPALITGAFADRMNFKAYLIFLAAWSLLVYSPMTHWMWGGGFLGKMGVVDFAGGIEVHSAAGMAALASVFFIGKRLIKPGEDMHPHNITYVALGVALLWFGWFGFNGGSALAANGLAAVAIINTQLAAATAMVTWLIISWRHEKYPSFLGALTGAVAGLVTITPASGFVEPWAAAVIGVMASGVCYLAVQYRIKMQWDDALDVWGVHGVGGILGTICVGIFASARINGVDGLIYGNMHQFQVQLFAAVLTGIYAFVVTYFLLMVINAFVRIRVTEEEEVKGLDTALHHEMGYNL